MVPLFIYLNFIPRQGRAESHQWPGRRAMGHYEATKTAALRHTGRAPVLVSTTSLF